MPDAPAPATQRPAHCRQTSMPALHAQDLSDDELDAFILARLRTLGVDLGVLPEDDPDAPVDLRRILLGARRFLRSTPRDILAWEPDPQAVVPALYPASLGRVLREGSDG